MNKKIINIIIILTLVTNFAIFLPVTHSDTPLAYDVYVDDDAAPEWYDATHVPTIQEGVNNATDGQSIYIYGGTYLETLSGSAYITIASKNLTIIGQQDDNPKICPTMGTSKYVFYFTGSGYSLTLQYLNISNAAGANITGDIAVSVPAQNNLIIDHCIIHDINFGMKVYGNLTMTNSTINNFIYGVEGSWSGATYALQMVLRDNIIYDSPQAGTGCAIKAKYGHWYGDISYNYIAGNRLGIWAPDPEGSLICKFGGNWTIAHNTIVSKYDPTSLGNTSQAISFASVSDNFSKIDCRDNLIAECNYYAINSGYTTLPDPYTDNMTVRNCLFYNIYSSWLDPVSAQKYFQWNGTGYSENITYGIDDVHTIAGWDKNTTAGYIFNFQNCIAGQDPLLNGAGSAPDCWGLQYGSPALNAASDGTNIGAWQGTPLSSNNPPTFGTPSPTNSSTGQSTSLSWSIPINDPEGDLFNWTIECNNGQSSNADGASNGTKSLSLSDLAIATTYTVWVNATDLGSGLYNRTWYTFQTITNNVLSYGTCGMVVYVIEHISNEPPTFGTPSPTNSSIGQNPSLTWQIPINDPDGNTFDWTIQCSNGQSSNANGASNGTKSLSITGLSFSTTYTVWVNATDGTDWTREWYTFTTKSNNPPSVISPSPNAVEYISVYNIYLNVTVLDADGDTMNVEFYWGNSSLITTINGVANNTQASAYIDWLQHDTNYTWYVKVFDPYANSTSSTYWFITSKSWDCNGDETVNYLDVSIVVSNYGASGYLPGEIPADIIEDGAVNYLDVSSLVSHYGESY